MTARDEPRRPRDLAWLLLSLGGYTPRLRARDQQADLAGGEIRRRVLDRVVAVDPEPDRLEASLAAIVEDMGEPTGPTRSVCLEFSREWADCRAVPGFWAWLLDEAVAGADRPEGRRRRGSESVP